MKNNASVKSLKNWSLNLRYKLAPISEKIWSWMSVNLMNLEFTSKMHDLILKQF